MKVALYGKAYINVLNRNIEPIINAIKKVGFELEVYEKYFNFLKSENLIRDDFPTFTRADVSIDQYACLVSIGGDGTLLDTVTIVGDSGVPVVGINAGRLGFISSISVDEIEPVLRSVVEDNFECDERSLITVETKNNLFGEFNYALNELTVHKKDTSSMIKIQAYLDDEFLNSYWADGLIISSPTGSTAYSMSCGGPIVLPGSENFVITPIAPHNLNVRPAVVSNDSKIRLQVEGRSDNYLIALDSRTEILHPNEEVILSKAPFSFKLIKPEGHSFISTMRNKLGWGLDKRN